MNPWSIRPVSRAATDRRLQGDLRPSALETRTPDHSCGQKCVHEFFEAQAARAPDAIAATLRNETLTYAELDERANGFAARLRDAGIGADALAGICVEPSLELAIGLLGILKAGGAYVPLDPAYPRERLAAMLSDAQPRVIATQRHLASRLSSLSQNLILIDDFDAHRNGAGENYDGEWRVRPDQIANVIFTSGSTGRPKGVLISHRSLANHAAAMSRQYELGPSDRVLQFASFSFDVAAEEIFPTWASGATVVFWPEVIRAVPIKDFLSFVERQEITVVNLPTPYWEEWALDLDHVGIPPSVRLVIVGSEKVPSKIFSLWQHKGGNRVRWCNAYGPTEATVTATIYEARVNGRAVATDTVPIGKPIANVEVHVLDANLKPVPAGVPGELHIGGAGVANGYLNRPGLTAEKFIHNPFRCDQTGRLYRTGDLVRCLEDGNLEFLGRLDDQIKIRGHRIEPGEIEAALRRHPAVANAVIVAKKDGAQPQSLTAYMVERSQPAPSCAELVRFLRDYLPEHMIPARFVFLQRLPLTPSGKVDRAALAARAEPPAAGRDEMALPRDPIERQLVGLWEKVLGIKPIGIRDNFFDLGGHSLLILRLITQIERKLKISLPVSAVQQAPTIEQLAMIARQKKSGLQRRSRLLASQNAGSKPPIFFYGGSLELARSLGADQPTYLLENHGLDGWRAPGTIEQMAEESIGAIRDVQTSGPYFLAGYSFGGLVIYEVAQQLKQRGEEVALLVLIDPSLPHIRLSEMDRVEPPPPEDPVEEFLYHWRKLARLNLREKLDYIAVRVCGRARMLKTSAKRAACKTLLDRGYRLPPFARMFYFMEYSGDAIRCYTPRPYAGRLIVLRCPENGTGEEWRHLAAGELEVHDLDAPGHLDLIQEPYVQTLGGKLRDLLVAAQRSTAPVSV
jgi:aspartate racemase